ncbi:hypothetical protein [Hymenobacter daeguensis]
MKRLFLPSLLAAAGISLASCSKDHSAPSGEGLVGTWKLVDRQCYCVPAPTPHETAVFTPTAFAFTANGQLKSSGTYAPATVSVCGMAGSGPGLRLSSNQPNVGSPEVQYTLTGNRLILDYGGPCDAPRDTYERVQ